MYIDKTFADVTINVSGIEFKAHRSVLAAASPYFEKALQYERTEQNNHNPVPQFIEGAQRAFSFPEENVQAFARVLRYMYVRSYSDQPDGELNTPDDAELTLDVRVYQLADYFGIDDLQLYSLENFKAKIQRLWMSRGFIDCIPVVYALTRDDRCQMRTAVINSIDEHWNELPQDLLKKVVHDGGDFSVELVEKLAASKRVSP
ncbi:hypothetical protein NQ176_g1484 [Zarea fungicola]|uniref:Uncharacterized protein n=1 Tax=Zarea fungicola TaxID=93591 RepID=A0ACC1NU10_9HYPO|nr:hypothetical protein NQ176_g1484 [Lecanicillium fungicola]